MLAKLGCEWVMPGHCWKQENKLAREEVQDVVSRGLGLAGGGKAEDLAMITSDSDASQVLEEDTDGEDKSDVEELEESDMVLSTRSKAWTPSHSAPPPPVKRQRSQDREELEDELNKVKKTRLSAYQRKKQFEDKKRAVLEKAKQEFLEGVHKTIYAAAKSNSTPEMKIPRSTLANFVNKPPSKPFQAKRGKTSTVMMPAEEAEVKKFVTKRAELGCGLSFSQLQDVLTEVLQRIKTLNPARQTSFENRGQCPPKSWVYRFVTRNGLVLS